MTQEAAVDEIVRSCNALIENGNRCAERLAMFFAYYVDGEGMRPPLEGQPEYVLNPKLNGTSALMKRLRAALASVVPGEMPRPAVDAMARLTDSAMGFVRTLEYFCRCESLSVSYTCEYDIFQYMTVHTDAEVTPEMHAAVLKAKFKALKNSFYSNATRAYTIASEVMAKSPYKVPPPCRYTYADIMSKLSAAAPPQPPQEVVVVGMAKSVSLGEKGTVRRQREVTLDDAESMLRELCRRENLGDYALSRRTFMRWEAGECEPKAGYSPSCRDSLAAFLSWMKSYIIAVRADLAAKRALVRFNDNLHSVTHHSSPSPSSFY